nr:hypothetical protein [uncultured Sphingobacterium sp.]
MPWYIYCPTGPAPYNACDPVFYTSVGSFPPSCPNPNNFLCAIQANDTGGNPIFTITLLCEMATAINNRLESTNVKLRPTITC